MQKIFLALFLIIILFPISSGYSQVTDTPSTLSVELTSQSPFVYKDAEGYTVVIGNVENKNQLTSVSNVQLRVNFYDDTGLDPLETVHGGTVLEVIPELRTSPYMIKSTTPNPSITQVSVVLESFSPSQSKTKDLTVEVSDVYLDENLKVSGILTNGGSPITDTYVYLTFYDAFIPPRMVGVASITIGDLEANKSVDFYFDGEIDRRAVSFKIFSESSVFYSDILDQKVPQQLTKLVTISDVSLSDNEGNRIAEVSAGSVVNIQSNTWVQFSTDQKTNETPFTYYAQVKQSGKVPYVEYLGKYEGRFIGTGSQPISIDWIPERSGVYFIETFVWDRSNIPIADKGPIILIVVN